MGTCDSPLNPGKTGRKVLWCLFFFLLLLGTSEQMFEQTKLFSQKWIHLSAVHLLWQWILKVLGRVLRVFPYSYCTSAPYSGKDAHLDWAGPLAAGKGQSKGPAVQGMLYSGLLAPILTDPVTVTILSKLLLVSHTFCSLILTSGSFQPRENSLQVLVLNPMPTITLSEFPKL